VIGRVCLFVCLFVCSYSYSRSDFCRTAGQTDGQTDITFVAITAVTIYLEAVLSAVKRFYL